MHPYVQILKDELTAAMGCTEPIAIAYAAALARNTLGAMPDRVTVQVSRNIIKNVKSVIVPNTGGLHGVEAAVAAGIVMGDPALELEVLSHVSSEGQADIRVFMENVPISVSQSKSNELFEIDISAAHEADTAEVIIRGFHTNVVLIKKNSSIVSEQKPQAANYCQAREPSNKALLEQLTVAGIVSFADTADIEEIRAVLDRQIACNMAIAEEGLRGNYGANIGKVLLATYGDSIMIRARAKAAAASDARMNGCEMPVVINSGSGNQGITVSVPVIEYARELGVSRDKLYRALIVSNLCAIHLKSGIGCLSAYCGAVTAGCAAGAGIAYLYGGGLDVVSHTLVNALAIASGIICDGAKSSCAAKIAAAVDAGLLGWSMYQNGQEFHGGEGIVEKGVENTIHNIGRLGHDGMRGTDEEIIKIMLNK